MRLVCSAKNKIFNCESSPMSSILSSFAFLSIVDFCNTAVPEIPITRPSQIFVFSLSDNSNVTKQVTSTCTYFVTIVFFSRFSYENDRKFVFYIYVVTYNINNYRGRKIHLLFKNDSKLWSILYLPLFAFSHTEGYLLGILRLDQRNGLQLRS